MVWGHAVGIVTGCLGDSSTGGSVSWQFRHCSGTSDFAKTFRCVCLLPPHPAAATLRKACMGNRTGKYDWESYRYHAISHVLAPILTAVASTQSVTYSCCRFPESMHMLHLAYAYCLNCADAAARNATMNAVPLSLNGQVNLPLPQVSSISHKVDDISLPDP